MSIAHSVLLVIYWVHVVREPCNTRSGLRLWNRFFCFQGILVNKIIAPFLNKNILWLKWGFSARIWLLLEDKLLCFSLLRQRWFQATLGKHSQTPGGQLGCWKVIERLEKKVVCFLRKLKFYEKIRSWSCGNLIKFS